jgi:hypothetical protein
MQQQEIVHQISRGRERGRDAATIVEDELFSSKAIANRDAKLAQIRTVWSQIERFFSQHSDARGTAAAHERTLQSCCRCTRVLLAAARGQSTRL